MNKWSRIIASGLMVVCATASGIENLEDPTPTLEQGAKVFTDRCVLCHGSQGMGEGVIPLKLKDYPDTNLTKTRKAKGREEVYETIVYGGTRKGISEYMPPFGKELSWTELESVAKFILLMRSDTNKALAMLDKGMDNQQASTRVGEQVYSTRCVLCHGKYGEGDGRMSKILKHPPPADLTVSKMPAIYLDKIISLGGEAVGRSKHMPPWGDQLSKAEIESVILYIISIRD